MPQIAAKSVLDIANWFFKKAENSKCYLEEDKLQPLLFLAQMHYRSKHREQYLMPALFICDNHGFFEPNLRKILRFGMPLMDEPSLDGKTKDYLEIIWQKYANKNAFELISIVKNLPIYQKFYSPDEIRLVSPEDISQDIDIPQPSAETSKVLISQNGPVVVSKWQPRKLDDSKK